MVTKVMGIDLEIGTNNDPKYAVYCQNGISSGYKTYRNITPTGLISLIGETNPSIIATDNIKELIYNEMMTEYFWKLHKTIQLIQVTASNPSQMTSVLHEARKFGIPLKNKPWPVQTAIICTLLASKNVGSKITLTKSGPKIKIKFQPLESGNTSKRSIDINLSKEMTEREAHKSLVEHPFVESVVGVIGQGKEANIYLIIDRYGEYTIVKSFRTYTSVADSIRSSNYKMKPHHAPVLLAKLEAQNLIKLAESGIPVPHVKFRDGALVGMQAIMDNKDSLVKPLSTVGSLNNVIQTQDVLEQVLDALYNIFKKCRMVHGDFSANNILYDGNQIHVIDVSQATSVNFRTFIDTPKRIRFDKGVDILLRDLNGIITFFEKQYRVKLEREHILSQFIELIPRYFQDKVDLMVSQY
ncbi:MAG: RIO1 family regulatory kinase/ATPase domain-containing protein [Candidatus Kariarchaeaceae archaeon]|jgi:serine/threonine-protein kinase RIO1